MDPQGQPAGFSEYTEPCWDLFLYHHDYKHQEPAIHSHISIELLKWQGMCQVLGETKVERDNPGPQPQDALV